MTAAGRGVEIHSDLDLQAGSRHARLLANGSHLQLITDDPAGLWAESSRAVRSATNESASVRTVITQTAAALNDAGLSVEVTGSRGTVIELGHGRGSSIGRIATGSPHVRLGNPIALGSAAVAGRSKPILVATSVVFLAAALRRRRRRLTAP